MKIAIIGSGGDGAGMNQCLYELCKKLKKHEVVLFYRGFQGLINNSIANIPLKTLKQEREKGGIIIKSSRSAEFLTQEGFNKAVKNLHKNKIDVLIVMGGNGSFKGVKKLANEGINCLFIPTTIDNDIEESDYCIGYSTAVANAVDFVEKVDVSMQAFDRICIYEVMGRHCPDIAISVNEITKSNYCYTSKSSKSDCLKKIKKAITNDVSPKIILQENVIDNQILKNYLTDNLKNKDVKVAVVGYVQRGGMATKHELIMATGFAKKVVDCVNKQSLNKIICFNNREFIAKNI